MYIVSRMLASLEARLNQPIFNIWRTLYFNFRTMPFSTAIRMPVFIYGRVRLFELNGCVKFENTEIKRGMVKIGVNGDSFTLFDHTGYVQLGSESSILIFEGPCRIALNVKIRVQSGTLRLGNCSRIGSDSKVICNGGRVSIGAFSGITFGCTIMNSSFHYTYDIVNKCYRNRSAVIEIGCRNWIGNQTTILGKCRTKDDTTVGAGSLINRDYSQLDGAFPLLAGRPAKLIHLGIKRVFSPVVEAKVSELFNVSHADTLPYEQIQDCPEDIIAEM
jgi:acetyltransferase-like isoleucine patch superfamily enzyme